MPKRCVRSTGFTVLLACSLWSSQLLAQQVAMPGADRMLSGQPATLFSYGKADGVSTEMLSRVHSLAFDAHDNLFILDGGNRRVIEIAPDGRFVRTFGKQGGGPGELTQPRNIAVASNGAVVVNDGSAAAFIVYSADGKYLRNLSYTSIGGFPDEMHADANGGVVGLVSSWVDKSGTFARVFTARTDGIGGATLLRKIAIKPMAEISIPKSDKMPAMSVVRDPIYGAYAMSAAVSTGEIVFSYGPEYAVEIMNTRGATVRTLTRPIPSHRTTQRDKDDWMDGQKALAKKAGVEYRGFSYEMPFAEYMAVITHLDADANGRLWIQRRGLHGSDDGPIDIVTAAGRYIGTLPPQRMPLAFSKSGRIAWVDRDEDGVETVRVASIPASWR